MLTFKQVKAMERLGASEKAIRQLKLDVARNPRKRVVEYFVLGELLYVKFVAYCVGVGDTRVQTR